MDQILQAADGIMIARGDLGVEIPIEEMAVVQKNLMGKAVVAGKPVITATQMLESMVDHSRPTRAEATDVANAILDGTDCVMLSGESAMGKFPVESVAMLSKIAKATEPHRPGYRRKEFLETYGLDKNISHVDLIALSVYFTLERSSPAAIFVPTMSGATARNVARFRMPAWITAVSPHESTCQKLQFSYGVHAVHEPDYPDDWNTYAQQWVKTHQLEGNLALLTEGPSPIRPDANNRMEIIDLNRSHE
jgi:pyruvate kinase